MFGRCKYEPQQVSPCTSHKGHCQKLDKRNVPERPWRKGNPPPAMLGMKIANSHCSSSVQSLTRVRIFATPWTAARQASLSFTLSQGLLKLVSMEPIMPSTQSETFRGTKQGEQAKVGCSRPEPNIYSGGRACRLWKEHAAQNNRSIEYVWK